MQFHVFDLKLVFCSESLKVGHIVCQFKTEVVSRHFTKREGPDFLLLTPNNSHEEQVHIKRKNFF